MPETILPSAKPRLSSADLLGRVAPFNIDRSKYPVIIAGVRAYSRDTRGVSGANDRNLYDDAIFVHSPSAMVAFNGNTDASKVRKGWGIGTDKGMAMLKAGCFDAFGRTRASLAAALPAAIQLGEQRTRAMTAGQDDLFGGLAGPAGGPDIPDFGIPQVAEYGEVCRGSATKRLAWVDEVLAEREFIAGPRYTIADITLLIGIDFGRVVKIGIQPDQKNLARWYESVSSRPSAKA